MFRTKTLRSREDKLVPTQFAIHLTCCGGTQVPTHTHITVPQVLHLVELEKLVRHKKILHKEKEHF